MMQQNSSHPSQLFETQMGSAMNKFSKVLNYDPELILSTNT